MTKGIKPDGAKIGLLRTAMEPKVSQREFADRLGIHWVTQSNIENGKTNVSLELLERIAEQLGTTRDDIAESDAPFRRGEAA